MGMDDRVHVRGVDRVQKGLMQGSMLVCIFNGIRSKHLDRMLQTSMCLMFSSRHVKGGYLTLICGDCC